MAESNTVARPYAQGVFKLAREQDALQAWSDMLQFAATVVAHPDLRPALSSPRLTGEQKLELLLDICGDRLNESGQNLIRLLIENDRLRLLPAIAEQFYALRAEAERTVDATLVSAQAVDEDLRKQLAEALERRLDRRVNLRTEVDEALVGGAVIRAGDLVIDGSVQGKLKRLAGTLSR